MPAAAQLDRALQLQREGHAQQALAILERELPALRAAREHEALAKALGAASEASLSGGKYQAALQYSREALSLHESLKDAAAQARDWNALALADMYLGNYPASLREYERALAIDRQSGDREGEVARLNNIGNVYYFQGRYLDALQSFAAALDKVQAAGDASWNARRRQITIANLATVYQRLGDAEKALTLYSQFRPGDGAVRPSEVAQMLLNQGVLYRRLGDPLKALEMYRSAQQLFAHDQHRDGEIGALRNIGIARGLDLGDLPGALSSFQSALKLAHQAGNTRAEAQGELYRGEVLRRLHQLQESRTALETALASSRRAGLIEEQWKALYAIGLLSEEEGDSQRAADCFRTAIRLIETVRASLQLTALRTDFLADKRDVYDALIELRLQREQPDTAEIFRLIEHSRARSVQDRIASGQAESMSLSEVQARLDPESLLVEYWIGHKSAAALWITRRGAGVVAKQFSWQESDSVGRLTDALAQGSPDWRGLAAAAGRFLLSGLPLKEQVRHLVFVPDGMLSSFPFEALELAGSGALVIEKFDVSYLPSAALLFTTRPPNRRWRWPWERELVAIGDPLTSGRPEAPGLPDAEQWQPIPHSADEVRAIARLLDGRAEQHLGLDARKSYLSDPQVLSVALLHISSHAAADLSDPERSRILFAPARPGAPFDYLFLREIYGMDLKGVDLVTVSACDTERAKFVPGEGSQGFSRAFLAAGAAASVTSLWRVADSSTAEFMQQFYFGLSRGQSKAHALREAKLKLLRSGSKMAHPRYWAAFVLSGDSQSSIPAVVPWSAMAAVAGAVMAGIALFLRWRQTRARRIREQ